MENGAEKKLRDDEISIRDLIDNFSKWKNYFLSKGLIILFFGFLGGFLGVVYAAFKKPLYTAECTFVLQDDSRSGLGGQYSGIASILGINLDAGTSGLFQGDNIIELYKSRSMIERTLLSKVNGELLIDKYIAFNNLRQKWDEEKGLKGINFSIKKDNFTLKHDSIINDIVKLINKRYLDVYKPDKKLNIISVKFNSPDEQFAKDFTNFIVSNVNEFYVQAKIEKYVKTVDVLQYQADSVRNELNKDIGGVVNSLDMNPNANTALQILRVPSERKQIDVRANSAMYAEIVKNLEISKLSLRQETPLIQVIDKPVLPLEKQSFSKLKGFILGGFVAIVICMGYFFVKKKLRTTDDEQNN